MGGVVIAEQRRLVRQRQERLQILESGPQQHLGEMNQLVLEDAQQCLESVVAEQTGDFDRTFEVGEGLE